MACIRADIIGDHRYYVNGYFVSQLVLVCESCQLTDESSIGLGGSPTTRANCSIGYMLDIKAV